MATHRIAKDFPALSQSFFCRPAEVVGPELVGCRLAKRQEDGSLLWGVIVETEAYSQDEPACHGYRRRSPQNETLFGEPGRFYVYVSYGIHHCVNVVTDRAEWANGVLLRAIALPDEPERVAAGPALLARRFGLDPSHDRAAVTGENDVWLATRPATFGTPTIVSTTRIGISQGQDLPWRWYLKNCRSISRRAKGDRTPPLQQAWAPVASDGQ
ncbi:DNA-3-methyladenine glycosylase [Prochlorococcus marinus]|uniref:DNA-3-methyladenine glycosylase n=1 Tax=Prochlorococcus marinus TaxID=1219 RepID=UPI00059D961C|nr:DNA-3-methyladenine glycosylase [Prochlorococcus marinus]